MGFIRPEHFSGLDAEREDIIGTGDDIHDAVNDQRLRFTRVFRFQTGTIQVCAPDGPQTTDVVGINLVKRRKIPVVQISPVGQPFVYRQLHQGIGIRSHLGEFRGLALREQHHDPGQYESVAA